MALLSELVRIIAAVEGLEEVSVGIFARQAREAGFISQGGRGRSAAKMSISDAVNLLIAVNGCRLAKEVPEKLPHFRNLLVKKRTNNSITGLGHEGATFGEDMETMLRLVTNEKRYNMPGVVFVRFFKPVPQAKIVCHLTAGKKEIDEEFRYELSAGRSYFSDPDRSDETVISQATLHAVAIALQE